MSWSTTRTQIENLLGAIGFSRAPEVFDIEKQPATFIDSVFCIQMDEMQPNTDGFGDASDRFFPTQRVRISVSYDLFNGNQEAYDSAIEKNVKVIQELNNPNNRPDYVRMSSFAGSKTRLFKEEGNWLIVDNYFDLQVQVVDLDIGASSIVIPKQIVNVFAERKLPTSSGIVVPKQLVYISGCYPNTNTKYWVGGSGNWNDTSHWSYYSGGIGGADVPTSDDDVIIDYRSGNNIVINIDAYEEEGNANCSGIICKNGGEVSITVSPGSGYQCYFNIYGSAMFESGLSFVGVQIKFRADGIENIALGGATVYNCEFLGNGIWSLQDDFETGYMFISSGHFNANGYNVIVDTMQMSGEPTLILGSGTWTVNSWNTSPDAIIVAETSTIIVGNQFNGGSKSYYNVWLTGNALVYGSNTFANLKINAGISLQFEYNSIQTFTSLTAVGSTSNIITLRGIYNQSWKLSCASGIVSCDYIDIAKCTASGGATFYAGDNSIDNGNNSGWIFTSPP